MKGTAVTPVHLIESSDHSPEHKKRRKKGGQDEIIPDHVGPVVNSRLPFFTGQNELVTRNAQDRKPGLSVRDDSTHDVGIAQRGRAHGPSPTRSPRTGALTPAERSGGIVSKTSPRNTLNKRHTRRVHSPNKPNESSVRNRPKGASSARGLGPFPVRTRKHRLSPTKNAAAGSLSGSGGTAPPLLLDAKSGSTNPIVSLDTAVTEATVVPSAALQEKTAATLLKTKLPNPAGTVDPVRKNLQCVVKCAVELSLLLAVVVTLSIWLRHGAVAPMTASPCLTAGCTVHSSEFNGTLNYSVDPCADMDAFVCSVWRSRGAGEDHSSLSLFAHVIREYEARVADIFLTGRTEFAASRMATDFLRKCTQRQAAPSLDSFKHFFALNSLPWPFDVAERVDTGLRPLERVLSLSLMWDIDTWFRAYVNSAPVYESNTTVVLTLFIEASAQASLWLDFVRSLEMTQSRTRYYRRMHSAYNATLPDKDEVVRRLAVEKKILSVLDTVRASRTSSKPAVTSLRKILSTIANAKLSDWLEPIRAASGSKAADENELVSVQDVRLLRVVDELLSAHSSQHLLEHLSWWLLQRLTVIGWPQGYDVIAGSETVSATCFLQSLDGAW
ncbi:hypothetical protein HPB49_001871 [Dermacentor silvarum]|uniref:Uncharacterized protein n=1 Tax=Dermacentor silvarum TaxID=543639 RepID=A0ACB8DHG9_DERSI|nr:hypothetical protein HPB49_001871 [Dermacentor silvarum]